MFADSLRMPDEIVHRIVYEMKSRVIPCTYILWEVERCIVGAG